MVFSRESGAGTVYTLPKHQVYLLDRWTRGWDLVENLVRQYKARLVVVVGGDAVDGIHHKNVQIVSPKPHDHVRIAEELLRRPIAMADKVAFLRGTPAHVGQGAEHEEEIVDHFRALYPDKPISLHYIYELTTSGTTFNFAHHISGRSRRVHTHGNSLRARGKDVILRRALRGEKPPDVWMRGHIHQAAHETVRVKAHNDLTYKMETLVSPAFQLCTEFGYKLNDIGELADIGMYIFRAEDGEDVKVYEDHIKTYSVSDEEVY
jgi:hypothetical protein